MAIVYRHINPTNLETFYIGIGVSDSRAYELKHNRSIWHNNYTQKYGCIVDILIKDIDYIDAKEIEVFLISLYGRKDTSKGCLLNMTDGGDGTNNRVVSEETKLKMSQSAMGEKNSMFGRLVSKETRDKRSKSLKGTRMGADNPMFEKTPWNKGKVYTKDEISDRRKRFGVKFVYKEFFIIQLRMP